MQGQLQDRGTLPTIQHYMDLLGEAFLVSAVQKYSPLAIRTRRSTPKLIVHDNGLIHAFERPITEKISAEKLGHYFENAVGARLIEAGWETCYWKDRDAEVDFVVLGPNGEKWAVEVKSSKVAERELKGTLRFCDIYPEFTPVLVSLVGQVVDGFQNVSAEDVLSLHRHYK
jgi:predicted AAA+ superfamily ATPase